MVPTMACTRPVQCNNNVPLKNDGAGSLSILLKGALIVLYQVTIALECPVTYGQNSKDMILRCHSNTNSSMPLTIDLQFEDFMCATRTWTSTAPVQAAADADVSFLSEHRLNHTRRRAEKDS